MRAPFFLIAATTIVCAASVIAAEPDDLIQLRNSYISAKESAADPIRKRYVSSLHGLKLDFTQSGNLDGALAVDNELKAVSEIPEKRIEDTATAPGKLVILRSDYRKAVDDAVSPLKRKYLEALEPMKLKYTQLSKLDAAVAVDNEIKSLADPGAAAKSAAGGPIDPTKLIGTRWRLPDAFLPGTSARDRWVRFLENNNLEAGWSPAKFTWKINAAGEVEFAPFKNKGNVLRIAWDNESREGTLSDREGKSQKVDRVN